MKKCYCTALLNTFRQANIWSSFKHSGCTLNIFFTNKIYTRAAVDVFGAHKLFFFFLKQKPHASSDVWSSVFEMLWSGVVSPPLWLGTLQSLIQLWSLHHIKGCLSAWKYRLKSRNGPFKNTMHTQKYTKERLKKRKKKKDCGYPSRERKPTYCKSFGDHLKQIYERKFCNFQLIISTRRKSICFLIQANVSCKGVLDDPI